MTSQFIGSGIVPEFSLGSVLQFAAFAEQAMEPIRRHLRLLSWNRTAG
jgi:hypothetical protein